MHIEELVKLCSKAWGLNILAQMHAGVPGRQAPLLAASGAGRTAFAQSLRHLVDAGFLERSPGHGHPLRPEFRLTGAGQRAAKVAHAVLEAAPSEGQALLRKSWTVPILAALGTPRSFGEMRGLLAPISDRALSMALKELEEQDWAMREVDGAARPPRPIYSAVNAGARIGAVIAED